MYSLDQVGVGTCGGGGASAGKNFPRNARVGLPPNWTNAPIVRETAKTASRASGRTWREVGSDVFSMDSRSGGRQGRSGARTTYPTSSEINEAQRYPSNPNHQLKSFQLTAVHLNDRFLFHLRMYFCPKSLILSVWLLGNVMEKPNQNRFSEPR